MAVERFLYICCGSCAFISLTISTQRVFGVLPVHKKALDDIEALQRKGLATQSNEIFDAMQGLMAMLTG